MKVLVLGTRGIPACYGGFETFAEQLAKYLVGRGHEVVVYCQNIFNEEAYSDVWQGIQRVHIPAADSPVGTIEFDWKSVQHASKTDGVVLTLGYNTAVFSLFYKVRGVPHVMNMDGLEWRRAKWSRPQRTWLWMNEIAGAWLANHLVADHPDIKHHLRRHTRESKITVIPYAADRVEQDHTEEALPFELERSSYFLVIARPEPENSVLEIVQAFSRQQRSSTLVVLGKYSPEKHAYQKAVIEAAGANVLFPGPLYDREKVARLRLHAKAYVHGHTVGGTNPSLVESLAAGNPIVAHDNCFTRWVAGEKARYFRSADDLSEIFTELETRSEALGTMRAASLARHAEDFTPTKVLGTYENLLARWCPQAKRLPVAGKFGQPMLGEKTSI